MSKDNTYDYCRFVDNMYGKTCVAGQWQNVDIIFQNTYWELCFWDGYDFIYYRRTTSDVCDVYGTYTLYSNVSGISGVPAAVVVSP